MTVVKKFTTFGEHLRTLREINSLTLREVAASLALDTSLLAKIERNERQPTRQLIKQFADFFKVEEKELVDVTSSLFFRHFELEISGTLSAI